MSTVVFNKIYKAHCFVLSIKYLFDQNSLLCINVNMAKVNIKGARKYMSPSLGKDTAKSHGKGYNCIIIPQERSDDLGQ